MQVFWFVLFMSVCSRLVCCFLKTRNVHRVISSNVGDVGNDECADDGGCPYAWSTLFPTCDIQYHGALFKKL